MPKPPSNPSADSHVLPVGNPNPAGMPRDEGKFVTPRGTRSVKPNEAEPQLIKGITIAPPVETPCEQRTVTQRKIEGGEVGGYDTDSLASDDSDFSDLSEDDFEDWISTPRENYPVPVNADTEGATLTISKTGADKDSTVSGDESISIEGAGKVSKNKFLSAVKAAFNWFKGLFDNKIVAGLVLFLAFALVFGLLASPVGAPFGFVMMAGLSAAVTCGLMGLLVADMVPFPDQQQSNSNQNSNSQNNSTDKSTSETDKAKTQSDANQQHDKAGTEAKDTDGSSRLTPNGETAPAPEATSEGGKSPLTDEQASVTASKMGGGKDESSPEAIFDQWLAENILRYTNKAHFAEFSKTLRARDDFEELDDKGENDVQSKLETVLKGISDPALDLSTLIHAPNKQSVSSGLRQENRVKDFREQMKEALEALNPKVEYRQKMYNSLLQALPGEKHPQISPYLNSPLISVGETRQSLEGLSKEDLAKIEIYDLLRVALQELAGSGEGGGELHKESDEQERRFQPQPVTHSRAVDFQDESPAHKVRIIERRVPMDVEPVESSEEGVQVREPDDEFRRDTVERQQRILQKFERSLNYDTNRSNRSNRLKVPEPTKKTVRFKSFFTNIKDGVENWDNRKAASEKVSIDTKADPTAEHYQKLVIIELGKAVFTVGTEMMKRDISERFKKNEGDQDRTRLIDIDSQGGRLAFLNEIFASQAVLKVFQAMEATDDEQKKAKEYLELCLK